jgi:biopolymer transport protein ExbD
MAQASTIGGGAQENPVGVNITPMVDIIFCLCLFFICSFHFRQAEGKLETWLPQTHGGFQGEGIVDPRATLVDMRWRAGRLELGVRGLAMRGDPESAIADLRALRAAGESAGRADGRVVLLAGQDVPWEAVVRFLDLCRGAGIGPVELGAPEREP